MKDPRRISQGCLLLALALALGPALLPAQSLEEKVTAHIHQLMDLAGEGRVRGLEPWRKSPKYVTMSVMPISRPSLVPCLLLRASCPLRLVLLCLGLFLQACSIRPAIMSSALWRQPSPEAMQARLVDVSYPLLTAAADWCPFDQEPTYGFLLRDGAGTAVSEPDPTGGRVVVASVHPRLSAALAGLSVGDVLTHVNTVNVTGDSSGQAGQLINRLTRAKIQPLQLEMAR